MPWPFYRRRTAMLESRSEVGGALTDRFGLRLFRELVRPDPLQNVVFSPCSVMFCLAMMYEGATGETRQAIAEILGISNLDEHGRSLAMVQLKSALHTPGDVQLLVANSLWCNRQIAVRADYIARMREDLDAQVESVDFTSAETIHRINAWVRENTRGKISRIVESIPPLALIVALNAIYFKGQWNRPFDRLQTHDELFTTGGGQKGKVPMMRKSGRFRYLQRRMFQAVAIPYESFRTSMYVFLPARGRTLGDFEQTLTSGEWQNWMSDFEDVGGLVALPRFSVSYGSCLNRPLKEMGMAVAFDQQRARFEGISSVPPESWIDLVFHRAVAEVNEEGTEAAAVTSMTVLAASVRRRRERTFEMIVDRPFFFAIRDDYNGVVLFMGGVADPR
jgi:serine protease inhibitor